MELERFEELVDRDIHNELTPRETAELDAACLSNSAHRRAREQDRRLAGLMSRQGPNRAPAGLAAMIMDQIQAEAVRTQGFAASPLAAPSAEAPPRADIRREAWVEAPIQHAPSRHTPNQHAPIQNPLAEDRAARPLRLDWEQAARRRSPGGGIFALFTSSLFRWGLGLTVLGVIIYQGALVFRQPLNASSGAGNELGSEGSEVASVPDEIPAPPEELETGKFAARKADRVIASANEAEALKSTDDLRDGHSGGADTQPPADAGRLDAQEAPRKAIQVADAAPAAPAREAAAAAPKLKSADADLKRSATAKKVAPKAAPAKAEPAKAAPAKAEPAAKAEETVAAGAPAGESSEPAAAEAAAPEADTENQAAPAEIVLASAESKAEAKPAAEQTGDAKAGAEPASAQAAVNAAAAEADTAKLAEARARDEAAAEATRAAADDAAQARAGLERRLAGAEADKASRARADLERRLAEAEAERDKLKARLDDRKVASVEPAAEPARDELADRIESLRKRLNAVAQPAQPEPAAMAGADAPTIAPPGESGAVVDVNAVPETAGKTAAEAVVAAHAELRKMAETKDAATGAVREIAAAAPAAKSSKPEATEAAAQVEPQSESKVIASAAPASAPSLEAMDAGAAKPVAAEPAAPQPAPAPEPRRREPITLKKAPAGEPAAPREEPRKIETAQIPAVPAVPAVDGRALDAADAVGTASGGSAPAVAESARGEIVASVDDLRRRLERQKTGVVAAAPAAETKREPIRIAPSVGASETASAAKNQTRDPDAERLRESLSRLEAAKAPRAQASTRPQTETAAAPKTPEDPRRERARRERDAARAGGPIQVAQAAPKSQPLAPPQGDAGGAQAAEIAIPAATQTPTEPGRNKSREPVQIRAKGSDSSLPAREPAGDRQVTPVSDPGRRLRPEARPEPRNEARPEPRGVTAPRAAAAENKGATAPEGQPNAPQARPETRPAADPAARAKAAKARLNEVEAAIVSHGGSVVRRAREADKTGAYRFKVKVSRERLEDMARALEKVGVKSGKGASRYEVTDQTATTAEITVQVGSE